MVTQKMVTLSGCNYAITLRNSDQVHFTDQGRSRRFLMKYVLTTSGRNNVRSRPVGVVSPYFIKNVRGERPRSVKWT